MSKRSIVLVFFGAALFLPPIFSSAFGQAPPPASQAAAPRIDRFDLDAPTRLAPGEALIFRITGSPHGSASVRIGGVKGKIDLREALVGVYEGVYTIRAGDEITFDSLVIGVLRRGTQELSAVLDQPLVQNPRVAFSR